MPRKDKQLRNEEKKGNCQRTHSVLKSTVCLGLYIDLQTSCRLVYEIIRTESEGIPPELTCSGRKVWDSESGKRIYKCMVITQSVTNCSILLLSPLSS